MFTSKQLGLLFLFTISSLFAQNNEQILFEKAKYTMETQGDLKTAILQFEEIIEKYPDKKELGAKSQFMIGICYQKLGREEAKRAFKKVVENYPSETEIVIQAKMKLDILETSSEKEDNTNEQFQLQQVWAEPYDDMGSPSPDGKYISYVNWNVPCLAIYDHKTETSKDITSTKGTWDGDIEWAETSIWSPDGKKLVYVWYGSGERENIYGENIISLRIVGIDSSEPVEIFADEKVHYPHPCAWSKDGKYILASFCYRENGHEMVLISVENHSIKSLKRFSEGHPVDMSISPDGDYVTYTITPNMDLPQTDIAIISLIDGVEGILIDHNSTDFSPLWMPDGKSIMFFSDRTGNVGVWSINVTDGKPVGEEKLVKNLNRLSPKGITNNGNLFMTFHEGGYNVNSITIDPSSGMILSPPKRLVESNVGWNGAVSFSPNGQEMIYVSQRGVLNPSVSWGQQSLIIRNLQSGKEKIITPKMRILSNIKNTPPRWSPDGDEILITGRDQLGHYNLFVLNVSDTSLVQLFEGRFPGSDVIWSSNNEQLIYIQYGEAETEGIYLFDRDSKESKQIYSGGNIYRIALHPNGDKLAFVQDNVIKMLSLSHNNVEEFHKLDSAVKHTDIVWSPDGEFLYYASCSSEDTEKLYRIDLEGKTSQLINESFPHLVQIAFHPDGRTIAFTAGKFDGISSLWVMKNFHP